ncbi:MAG: bifunctional pyr operon transcriptional regulator/uracil phosphoribosyltransferase PyrR [Bacteroidota bacterium]|nr:bifunctional pyr operon transcriptional regulator/uracil phosphoribosyltransferase PyrR [Bacteroidota bacterium]
MKKKGKVILTAEQMSRVIERLCFQLIEHHQDFSKTCMVGIQQKGVLLAARLVKRINELTGHTIESGKLDITFFRDDFRQGNRILNAHETDIDFLIEGKKLILVDDVLYTGRTIQAALQAMQQFGRPAKVELLVLIDRRFNRHIPIQADYIGLKVDALDQAYVKVEWKEDGIEDKVLFFDAERQNV